MNRHGPSTNSPDDDELHKAALDQFTQLVESVGTKAFAAALNLSTRQVNRMLSGAQPNAVERVIRCLQSADVPTGDAVLDFICQEMGGHFVRHEATEAAIINAVKECAEAIAAISDGHISEQDLREIREAISALSGLTIGLRDHHDRKLGSTDEPPGT